MRVDKNQAVRVLGGVFYTDVVGHSSFIILWGKVSLSFGYSPWSRSTWNKIYKSTYIPGYLPLNQLDHPFAGRYYIFATTSGGISKLAYSAIARMNPQSTRAPCNAGDILGFLVILKGRITYPRLFRELWGVI